MKSALGERPSTERTVGSCNPEQIQSIPAENTFYVAIPQLQIPHSEFQCPQRFQPNQHRVHLRMEGAKIRIAGGEPEKRIADGNTAAANVSDWEIAAIKKPLHAQCPHDRFKRPGFRDGARVTPDVSDALQRADSFDV